MGLNHVGKHLDVMLVCVGLPHQECLPGAGPPEAYEGQLSCHSGHPGEDQRRQEISPARLFVASLKGTVRCCPGSP